MCAFCVTLVTGVAQICYKCYKTGCDSCSVAVCFSTALTSLFILLEEQAFPDQSGVKGLVSYESKESFYTPFLRVKKGSGSVNTFLKKYASATRNAGNRVCGPCLSVLPSFLYLPFVLLSGKASTAVPLLALRPLLFASGKRYRDEMEQI